MQTYTTPDGKYTFTNKKDYEEYMKAHYCITPEDEAKTAKRKEMNRIKYTQGVFIDNIPTRYGDMIKVTIDIDRLKDNEAYNKGKIIFCIKKARSGNYYAENTKF